MVKAKRPALALWAALLCLVLGLGILTVTARADDGGSCGDSVSWSFTEADGTLAITGTGAMADYADAADTPWYGEDIMIVTVDEGVTRVGGNAFAGLFLDNVLLPERSC